VGYACGVEVPLAFNSRRLVSEELASGLYGPVEYCAAVMAANLPIQLLYVVILSIPIFYLSAVSFMCPPSSLSLYYPKYMCVLQFVSSTPADVAFWIWTLFSLLLATYSLVRALAMSASSLAWAQTVAFSAISIASVFGGYGLQVTTMPTALLFLYYLSPFSWAIRRCVPRKACLANWLAIYFATAVLASFCMQHRVE
jgi:hypothetical protein